MISGGDDLAKIIYETLNDQGLKLISDDIVCVAQKVVSKAENRLIALDDVSPSDEAVRLAGETEKDPRLVHLILEESDEILRKKPGVLIVRHRLGIVGANAGIDQSNIDHKGGEHALLLPKDPDASARTLRNELQEYCKCALGVLITDSHNRPWRMGTIGGAIGCAGFQVLDDQRGGVDLFDRELKVTLINRADSIAALATLIMGETTEMTPVAVVKGFANDELDGRASEINRPKEEDLFQ